MTWQPLSRENNIHSITLTVMSHKRVLSSVTVLRLFFAVYSVVLKVVTENCKSQGNVFLPVSCSVIDTR